MNHDRLRKIVKYKKGNILPQLPMMPEEEEDEFPLIDPNYLISLYPEFSKEIKADPETAAQLVLKYGSLAAAKKAVYEKAQADLDAAESDPEIEAIKKSNVDDILPIQLEESKEETLEKAPLLQAPDSSMDPKKKKAIMLGVGAGINMLDNAVLGDKNFGALSEAIDTAVNTTSDALISSGNPYAAAAGVALKGANLLTKAGGNTVPGFDVEINSSGYDLNLGHYEDKSTRNWAGMLGLGLSTDSKKVQRMLDKRNEAVELAASAAQISNQLKFIQEARNNSVEDVLAQNQAVLNGGTTTNLLGA